MEHFARLTKEANIQAQQMFEKAIALDPQYAEAYARLGVDYWWNGSNQWNPNPQTWSGRLRWDNRPLLWMTLVLPHGILGAAYLWKKQYDQAIAEAERAIALAPNSCSTAM